jgi:ribosome-binding ATPase YchF (GTP1/OBG family)
VIDIVQRPKIYSFCSPSNSRAQSLQCSSFTNKHTGKSTLFNSSTGFARQKQRQAADATIKNKGDSAVDNNSTIRGGATMAPHPFTTIDPNVGFALAPAPAGSCPEDNNVATPTSLLVGSTHGRDTNGRRLVPVLLKDVAGLVPGAYQGRGRGNQFLNDLCDANVLIHVCDASGMADSEGNIVAFANAVDTAATTGGANVTLEALQENKAAATAAHSSTAAANSSTSQNQHGGASHPLHDMAWIRNELIEWVYTNVVHKWDIIKRKGRTKLAGMFSGYGQQQAMTWNILHAVEKYMEQREPQRARALEHLDEWDSGDLHRLVSAFLGVRFPIALALNKMDLPSSPRHIQDILAALPIHGTRVGIPLSARKEMLFVRHNMDACFRGKTPAVADDDNDEWIEVPEGTWQCLQSAVSLCEPVLVFPVRDHHTYAPLPGMFKYATSDPSLPSPGMVCCLQAAGGSVPSEWDSIVGQYKVPNTNRKQKQTSTVALRDVIMMRPGSTVNDVFLALKRLGGLGGEFVRAEASGEIGAPAKPIPKHQVVTKTSRILKIMTNKKTTWQ